ncbi:MAG: proprotein convertase P-domain-containing protein, partial [Bacteroidales bacterium]|nr:proprotein convertase P-domain-containing protein [Bacteroidales bacterium]
EDGYINVCWDDETNSTMPIEFTAQGIYPELPYQCNDSTNRFYWNFGDGTPIISGLGLSTVTHNFDQRKGYSVYLTIRDSMGCYNSNSAKQFVRVSLAPTFDQVSTGLFINPPSESPTICMGQEVEACAYFSSSYYSEDCNNTVGDTLPIPDNALECLESNAFIDCYAPGQLMTNTISMPKIHMNLAHSYLADLNIYISCPNGQQVQLCTQGGGGCYLGDPGQNHQISNDDSGFWYIIGQEGTQTMQQAAIGNSTLPSGLYASYQSLTGLVGCPLNGTWKLRICDQFEYDAGTLFGWWIEFDSTLTPEYLHYTQNYSTLGWSGAYGSTFTSEINQNCVTGSYLNTANSDEDTFQPFAFSVIDNFGCIHDTVMTLTVLASSNQECCIFPNTFAGFDESTCGYSYNLSASLTIGNQGMWSVAEGPGQVTFTDFENPTTDVTVFPDGDYLFVWKEFYQENTSCFTTDTVLIHFNPSLAPIIAPIEDVCAGSNSFQIEIEAIGELTCVPENGSFNYETGVFTPTIPDNYTITNLIYDPCQEETISYSESFVIKNKAVIVNFEENCIEIIPDSLAVQVTFDVVDAQNIAYQDFLINNNPVLEASSFDTIFASATNYSFTITDINGCTTQIIEGIRDCSCPLYAGTFESIDLITLCENECLSNHVFHNSDQNTDNGAAIFEFIIHSGDYIPLITSNSPSFCFDNEQLSYNTTYYLTAICGYPDFENHPDLNTSCHSLSQSVPVIWIQLPSLSTGDDIDTCGKIIQIKSNTSDEDYYGFWTSNCNISPLTGYTLFSNNTWIESHTYAECNFVRTISNGICSVNDSVIVNFNQVPQPYAGQDIVSCGLHAVLSGITSIDGSDFFWSTENLYISDTNNLESDLTATFEGTFEVILTETINGCQNTDNVLITFLHELDIWTTPDTDYVCDTSASVEVFGDFYGGNWNVYYHNTVLEPTFDFEFLPNNSSQSVEFVFDDLPQGVNNLMLDFVWNGINPYSGTDCETTVTKTIVFSRTPVANAGESEFISVCDNCVSLDADTTGFSWAQYYWVPNINGQFINSYSSPQTDFCIPMYELIEEDTINARFL